LGTSFGRGGATTFQQDLQNADCIVIEGSNMAECHPVGFQWVMEAKARGATIIHVDPRFTRTSALADLHVPIRAGSDIAFLGGLINHVLQNDAYFKEYVVAYTNAATILTEDYVDAEENDGLFSGFDPDDRSYDFHTWQYEGMEVQAASGQRDQQYEDRVGSDQKSGVHKAGRGEAHGSGGAAVTGEIQHDDTLQHPRCVFQVLKRHYARYTPEMVEEICGIPRTSSARSPTPWSATPAGTAPARSATPSAGPSTRSACSTSGRRRSSRACWATSAVRAAASWRCAGTRASRARRTSRRSTTSCPATSRCRTPTSTRTSTPTSRPTRPRRATGRRAGPTW